MKLTRLITLVAIFAVASSLSVYAQSKLARTGIMKAAPAENCVEPFLEAPANPSAVHPVNVDFPVSFRSGTEFPIGATTYDLQSNNSVDDRISRGPDGEIYGIWTFSLNGDVAAPDRGAGYNKTTDGVWGDQPSQRVEAARTGWPSHVITESGTECIISHVGAPAVHVARRTAGSNTWEESDIPSQILPGNGGPGILWPRATASGENIHVLAISYPVANGGTEYEGVDGHPLYYRSTDGGASWDKVDVILPGLDNTSIVGATADGYAIDSRGDVVAIAFFEGWSDVILMKSEDNGETWTKTIVNDFPLDRYVIDAGYTVDDLPEYGEDHPAVANGENASAADSLAILSNDEAGAVIIDEAGQAHVFWGRMYVTDADLTDGNSSYYPGTSGVMYWNESYGAGNGRMILDVLDYNGNDTLDLGDGDIALYFASLTGQPNAGIDPEGNIYLAYTNVMETEQFLNIEDNQYYRHILVSVSTDNGETWTEPYDIINPDVVFEPDLVDFIEAVFPSVTSNVDGTMDLVYQQDFRPGLAVRGDSDPFESCFINHVALSPEELGLVKTEETVQPDYFQLAVQPNPANNEALVSFALENNAQYSLSLLDIMGRKVADIETATGFASTNQVRVNVSNLTPGVYMLRLQSENKVAVTKLMVQ
ncbi:MAG: T9SS type A sorting domain-containing protein [Phaeodactylibacter sp.]|nr:T9SS type A sorting domain-containing protein [Phaeodactylibacter sp.]MCB9052077.1 T9SS type A sorting domain-containing protein [Lewinellaceae bacterium]